MPFFFFGWMCACLLCVRITSPPFLHRGVDACRCTPNSAATPYHSLGGRGVFKGSSRVRLQFISRLFSLPFVLLCVNVMSSIVLLTHTFVSLNFPVFPLPPVVHPPTTFATNTYLRSTFFFFFLHTKLPPEPLFASVPRATPHSRCGHGFLGRNHAPSIGRRKQLLSECCPKENTHTHSCISIKAENADDSVKGVGTMAPHRGHHCYARTASMPPAPQPGTNAAHPSHLLPIHYPLE